MKILLFKILLFTLLVLLSMHFYTQLLNRKGLIPVFSSSSSFDTKLWKYYRQHQADGVDVLAIGSSLTYYNLNSDIVLKNIPVHSQYYNLSSWHFTTEDLLKMSYFIKHSVKPKMLIWLDTEYLYKEQAKTKEDKSIPNSLELSLFDKGFYEFSYLKSLNLLRMKNRSTQLIKEINSGTKVFGNQSIDNWGGTFIQDNPNFVEKKHYLPDSSAYQRLNELCKFFEENNIKIIYVNSPYSSFSSKSAQDRENIVKHAETVKQIVEASGNIFVDGYSFSGKSDSLFADDGHMNLAGSQWLTTNIFQNEKVKSLVKTNLENEN